MESWENWTGVSNTTKIPPSLWEGNVELSLCHHPSIPIRFPQVPRLLAIWARGCFLSGHEDYGSAVSQELLAHIMMSQCDLIIIACWLFIWVRGGLSLDHPISQSGLCIYISSNVFPNAHMIRLNISRAKYYFHEINSHSDVLEVQPWFKNKMT